MILAKDEYTISTGFYEMYSDKRYYIDNLKETYEKYWTPFEDVLFDKLETKDLEEYRKKLLLTHSLKEVNLIFLVIQNIYWVASINKRISESSIPSILDSNNKIEYYRILKNET